LHTSQASYEFFSREVPVNANGRIRVTIAPGAADPITLCVSLELDDVDLFDADITVRVAGTRLPAMSAICTGCSRRCAASCSPIRGSPSLRARPGPLGPPRVRMGSPDRALADR